MNNKNNNNINNNNHIDNIKSQLISPFFLEVKSLYKSYFQYALKRKWLEIPEELPYREIGYGYLKKVDDRNIVFEKKEEYLKWVLEKAPFHLYKSLTYTEYPEKKGGASQKKLIKREIAFDIDVHKMENCTHKDEGWICDVCLNESKNQCYILIDEFLIPDFGLSPNDLKIVFSGNRGYHIYIKPQDEDIKKSIEKWDRYKRRYFIEYILGKNLNLNYVGISWRKRFINQFKKHKIGIKQFENNPNWAKLIENRRNKDKILNIINNTKNRLELDEKVMEDDIRLLRTIGSLHGYTGLIVKEIKYHSLEVFNPLEHSVFSKFYKTDKYYSVNIEKEIDDIIIKGEVFNHNSKEIPPIYLLFLFGHKIPVKIKGIN